MEPGEISSTTVKNNITNGYPAANTKYTLYIDTEVGKFAKTISKKSDMVYPNDQINLKKDDWIEQTN